MVLAPARPRSRWLRQTGLIASRGGVAVRWLRQEDLAMSLAFVYYPSKVVSISLSVQASGPSSEAAEEGGDDEHLQVQR